MFEKMTDHFRLKLKEGELNSQHVANMLWACARLSRAPGGDLLRLVERLFLHRGGEFSSQGMSNVLWSMVKIGHTPSDEFLVSFQQHFVDKMAGPRSGSARRGASPQNVANVLYSCVKLGHKPSKEVIFAIFEMADDGLLDSWAEQDVGTLLWACGKLEIRIPPPLLRQIEDFCLRRARKRASERGFSLHDVSLALWGFTQQPKCVIREEVLTSLLERGEECLDRRWSCGGFVSLLWAVSLSRNSGNRGAILVERYEEELLRTASTLSPYDASKLFCSMAFLGMEGQQRLYGILCDKILANMAAYDSSQLQSILNASEALDPFDPFVCKLALKLREALALI